MAFLAVLAGGCSDHYYPDAFETRASGLRMELSNWLNQGRPANFNFGTIPAGTYFVYTNTVKSTNGVFHCRFATQSPGMPPGVLAITDQGQVIFVCTNGKVAIRPDQYGVDP